jgi:hypothetical protein
MTPARRRVRGRTVVAVAVLVLILLGVGAIWANAFTIGDRYENAARKIELLVNPPPDRDIAAAVRVTPEPLDEPSMEPQPTAAASVAPGDPTPPPTPTPTPKPERVKVDVSLLRKPKSMFISQDHKDWCAVAGTQMVMAIHGKADLTVDFQRRLASRTGEWESRRDSLNGGWGPAVMVAALEAYGVRGYEVRAYETRALALRDAAKAISKYHAPVILLAWRGAHTWIMTGYRADADPLVFKDARVSGAYILDPWYPRVSSIWGPSDPPGTYQNASEMRRNYLPWKRPEGRYPDRDGLFIAVVPTRTLDR